MFRAVAVVCFCMLVDAAAAEELPERLQPATRILTTKTAYYWTSNPVANTSQLLTLFCRGCISGTEGWEDLPLISVLRDTLGDNLPENDRITYVWLLSANRLSVRQKILSAVPFFYWHWGTGTQSISSRDLTPLVNLNAPQHPTMSALSRTLIQWAAFDPLATEFRATSRNFWANQLDYERLHLETAISHLRKAPASNDSSALTSQELNTVIARLEFRKSTLGGLVDDKHAIQFAEESSYLDESVRSRNWEVLRQLAEKTGLYSETINLAGAKEQHAILWFPVNVPPPASGVSLKPVWKILNIKDPWKDQQLVKQQHLSYQRAVDENGVLLPEGDSGSKQITLIPLGVYSLNYPRQPLLLVDLRNQMHIRRHEMTQRSINELTAGVIGISHFTNWYYYAGLMLYDTVWARHGTAVNQAARLDCYSQFRAELALDHQLDPALRRELLSRAESLAVNPLVVSATRDMESARARLLQLQNQSGENGKLASFLQKERRAELADFNDSTKAKIAHNMMHMGTLGVYTHRVKPEQSTFAALDRERRLRSHLGFLDTVVKNGTEPEVAFNSSQIESAISQVRDLMPSVSSPEVKAHAVATLERLKSLSRDETLQTNCAITIIAFRQGTGPARAVTSPVIADSSRAAGFKSPTVKVRLAEPLK